jgi:dTDP-4-amino-4,6-dideoxygalactose transaminase
LGPNVNEFENTLCNYLGENKFVAALSSGTAALHLGLILLDVQQDDFVICQTMTFSASANPILYQKAIPVFVDSEMETWNMCPVALEEAITACISKGKKPKAIIPVHLYGMPYQVDAIREIANRYAIPILEDSAEALGSSYKEIKCGTFGDIAALSFNGNKIITTSGGGALVANSEAIKNKAVFFATQSRDNAPHYQHSEIGYNYRMSNICAGIGCGQMEVLDKHVNLRRANHAFYKALFQDIEYVSILEEPNESYYSNHWLSAILLDSFETREALRMAFEAQNIETRPLWKPMHLQPVFQEYPYYGNKIAETLFDTGLCLPSGSNLSKEDKIRIQGVINQFFTNFKP